MNLIDLELYKWQLHRMGAFNSLKLKSRSVGISKLAWWAEGGAFISMMPRQSGKTEMMIRMAKIFQKENQEFLFVVPYSDMKKDILRRFPINENKIEVLMTATTAFNFGRVPSREYKNTNLLIDEYNLLHKDALKNLFNMDWKSVSMTGGLKL